MWHKWTGVMLSLVMAVLALSGMFIAYKKQLDYLQPSSRNGTAVPIAAMVTPAEIEAVVHDLIAAGELPNLAIDRIELRPEKAMYKVRLEAASAFSSPREIQVDAGTGDVLNLGVRGDQLWMDVHSFGVFGLPAKLIVMTLSGLSLFWLALSGIYLFVYPRWYRSRKHRLRSR